MKHHSFPNNEIVELSTKSKVLQCLLLIPLITVSAIMMLSPVLFYGEINAKGIITFSSLGFLLVLSFTYSLVSAFKAKFLFDKNKVVQIGVFKTRTVLYQNILGYCITESSRIINFSKPEITLSLIPNSESGSKHSKWVDIDLKRNTISEDLLNFIQEEFADLNEKDEEC